ncbi:MAG: HEAT repeat domain-containing protein [Planctomycetota bacterium]
MDPLALALALGALAPPAAPPAAAAVPVAQETSDKEAKKKREKEARAAAETLGKALGDDDPAERRAAIVEASKLVHPRVIEAVAKALGDADVGVRREAIDALGNKQHEDALDALRRFARKERRKLAEDQDTNVTLIRAIGRHADESTTSWLARGALEEESFAMREARVFAVANRRSAESLDALFDEMARTDARRVKNHMRALRPALTYLSGVDNGDDPARWAAWWRENEKGFEVPAKPPAMPTKLDNAWRRFWGEGPSYERRKKRGDRG